MRQLPLLEAQIARPIVSYLDANGADPTTYLDRVRIPGEIVEAGGWIAKKQLYDMLQDVVQRERCPNAIFAAYSRFEVEDSGPIADGIKASRTLKDALRVVTRLSGLAYEGNEYFLRSDLDTAWLCYREREPVSTGCVAGQQATLAVFLQLIRLLVDESWQPRMLLSQFQIDKCFQEAEGWQECEQTHTGTYTAIAFPTSFLSRDLPWVEKSQVHYEADSHWQLGDACGDDLVHSLERLIASRYLFRPFPTLPQLAAIVGLSTRTLKRRLSEKGLSYRHLLDRICFEAAREMLLAENYSVKEIALALHFSDTSKFVRSFRRMTGSTPGEYQRLNS